MHMYVYMYVEDMGELFMKKKNKEPDSYYYLDVIGNRRKRDI